MILAPKDVEAFASAQFASVYADVEQAVANGHGRLIGDEKPEEAFNRYASGTYLDNEWWGDLRRWNDDPVNRLRAAAPGGVLGLPQD
jgi:hypothetical protein